jgi:aquaporin Z
VVLQFVGGVTGVLLARAVLSDWIAHPSVNYVITVPGRYGELWAFVAEMTMTFILMSVILWVSNTRALNRYTGLWVANSKIGLISGGFVGSDLSVTKI